MPKAAGKDKEMDGVEKAAILLIALGPEKSAQIFKHLKEDEIEQLTLEIANTSSVSPQTKEMVLNEFYEVCLAQQYIAEGGISYAKELLEKALGEDKAKDVIVVKSKIEALGGDVEVKTKYGEGSTFSIRLPLTLAIIQALMVKLGDEKYAISLGSIETIEDIPVSDIKYVHAKEVIHLRGNVIPLIRLRDLLDVPGEPEESENITVVVVRKGDKQAGLVVDSLIGQMEIVIKSLGKYIRINKMISGATILGDGSVALIIDANTLV